MHELKLSVTVALQFDFYSEDTLSLLIFETLNSTMHVQQLPESIFCMFRFNVLLHI